MDVKNAVFNKSREALEILTDSIIEDEYIATIEGDWLINNTGFLANEYRALSYDGQKAYALAHAVSYANTMLDGTIENFIREFGDNYDSIINIADLQNYF